MIQTKKDLRFYILADRIMNGRSERRTVGERLKSLFIGGGIIEYLRAMRHYAYYTNTTHNVLSLGTLLRGYWGYKYKKLGIKLGFTIGYNSLGYGVLIPHYGTIVVNGDARVGNFAVLHTCTCIAGKKEIGNFFYFSTGSLVTGNITLGDGVTVAAHSLVNKSFDGRLLLAGAPAIVRKNDYPFWTERDGVRFLERVNRVEKVQKRIYNGTNLYDKF